MGPKVQSLLTVQAKPRLAGRETALWLRAADSACAVNPFGLVWTSDAAMRYGRSSRSGDINSAFSVSQAGVTLGSASQASPLAREAVEPIFAAVRASAANGVKGGRSRGRERRVVEPTVPDGGLRPLK